MPEGAPAGELREGGRQPPAVSEAMYEPVEPDGDPTRASLQDQVRQLQRMTLALMGKAQRAGQLSSALSAVSKATALIELQAKLIGQLRDGGTTITLNVVQTEEFRTVAAKLDAALQGPEWAPARQRVLAALGVPTIEGEAALDR